MLIPMAFLIGIWGHERRIYAAVKFVLYTMTGSILMLVGIIWLYNATGTFDLPKIQQLLQSGALVLPARTEMILFLAFFLAFAIKVPLFPLHTWLPDAHVEAPTAGSVILAGVLLKLGTYGMIRFCLPLFPNASRRFAPAVAVLAIIGIIYGALVALVQPNLKKLVAYSSVSHLGFVVLGIFAFNRTASPPARFSCSWACSMTAATLLKYPNTAAWPRPCPSSRPSFCSSRCLRSACPCSMASSANT
jgi:NADH-quinone oxidoreductase subunit M